MKKILNCLFIISLLISLTGCPLNYVYRITDKSFKKNYESKVINKKNIVITFDGAHPLLIKGKKHVYLSFQLINLNDSIEQIFDVSDLNIFSKEGSFELFKEKPFTLYGNEVENNISITLKSSERKSGWFDFCSKKDYAKKEFNQSVVKDTLMLKINSTGDFGYLIGRVFKSK
jgi:hypothetical protein